MGGTALAPKPGVGGLRTISGVVSRIYAEGGVLAFWTGNGLSVMKIFPESAIKFLAYESAVGLLFLGVRPPHVVYSLSMPQKRAFARHWDHVEDPRDISGTSRFLSGGIGGLTSQLSTSTLLLYQSLG